MPEKVKARRLYDLCRLNQGEHDILSIYPLDDEFTHQYTPWHLNGFVVYYKDYCWEVKRIRKFKLGQPDGFDYYFEDQTEQNVTLDQALQLLQEQLNGSSK